MRALDSWRHGRFYGSSTTAIPDHGGDAPPAPRRMWPPSRASPKRSPNISRAATCATKSGMSPTTSISGSPRPTHANTQSCYAKPRRPFVRPIQPPSSPAAGPSDLHLSFISSFTATGAARDLNAIAVHPYRKTGPETIAPEFVIVRDLIARALGQNVALWNTEWGYSSAESLPDNGRVDGHGEAWRTRQAVLAVREALTTWTLGISVAVWYDLRDDGTDQTNAEHNFGLLDSDGKEKPAMKAIRVLSQTAANCKFAGMVRDKPAGMHAMRLDGASDSIFIVWSTEEGARVPIRVLKGSLLGVTNMLGEPINAKNKGSDAEVTVSEASGPLYVRLQR